MPEPPILDEARWTGLVTTRVECPGAILEAAHRRLQPEGLVGRDGRLMLVAADHAARGALRAGRDPLAMANRRALLERLCVALSRPGVDGVLGTADILEDLLLLGVLEGKVVIASMNRGGLAGTSFEVDDRFTAYPAQAIQRMGWQGGKMLLRIDPEDPATAPTLEACARAVDALAERRLVAMVEPFIAHRVDGRVRNDLSGDAVVRSCTVAAGLGGTSAYTWLKLPVVDDMDRVLEATSLPVVLLGGEVSDDQAGTLAAWRRALEHPSARGLVVGRALLFPPDGDVPSAVDAAAGLIR